MRIAIPLAAAVLALGNIVTAQDAPPLPPKPRQVVVIGIDGLSTDGLQSADTPNIDLLIRRGALSLTTRGVMPTVSAPNWASMLLGAGPEQHGITKNGWLKENATIVPAERDADGYFPSIFSVVRKGIPGSKTAMFYDWDDLENFYNPRDITESSHSKDYRESLRKAASYILADRPVFTFVYIGHVDEVGHDLGHGTSAYRNALTEVDDAIGDFLDRLGGGGARTSTLFFVISDHGGVGFGHGGESMAEIEVPWIVSGPGTISDRVLQKPNNSLNTAPTVAWALGLRQPEAWVGKPVLEAFDPAQNGPSYIPRPRISEAGGVYLQPRTVTLSTKEEGVPIRYTLDGSVPGINSPVYRDPIRLEQSATVKAVTVDRRGLSPVATSEIVIVEGVESLSLATLPSVKYAAGGVNTLVDGKKGTANHGDGRWLGFDGNDLELLFDLGEARACTALTVGCLNDTAAWIFLPAGAEVHASPDGMEFRTLRQKSTDLMKMRPGVMGPQSFTLSFEGFRDRYLRLLVKNIGDCPPGHSAAGRSAWLFIDEVTLR